MPAALSKNDYKDGKHRPNNTSLQRFSSKVGPVNLNGCMEWVGVRGGAGYGYFALNGHIKIGAHVAAYILHVGPVHVGMEIGHTCGNKLCVNPNHLILCSRSENMAELVLSGRPTPLGKTGPENVSAKLTYEAVQHIRDHTTTSPKVLADRFGVTPKSIRNVWRGVTWASM